jgi:hypothetical protein
MFRLQARLGWVGAQLDAHEWAAIAGRRRAWPRQQPVPVPVPVPAQRRLCVQVMETASEVSYADCVDSGGAHRRRPAPCVAHVRCLWPLRDASVDGRRCVSTTASCCQTERSHTCTLQGNQRQATTLLLRPCRNQGSTPGARKAPRSRTTALRGVPHLPQMLAPPAHPLPVCPCNRASLIRQLHTRSSAYTGLVGADSACSASYGLASTVSI